MYWAEWQSPTNYIQSPIGLLLKSGLNKTRLIFHLSYNFGSSEQERSLNYHTPRRKCTVKYWDLDEVIRACLEVQKELDKLDSGHFSIYLGKLDAKSTFHILLLKQSSWKWLTMMAFNSTLGKRQFFVNKCLSFGASISCVLFQCFSDVLCHIIHFRTCSQPRKITNYLDDFLFVAITHLICNAMIQKFLEMCMELGVPIADDKIVWGCTRLVFFGIPLDGQHLLLYIPEEKCVHAIKMLCNMTDKRK